MEPEGDGTWHPSPSSVAYFPASVLMAVKGTSLSGFPVTLTVVHVIITIIHVAVWWMLDKHSVRYNCVRYNSPKLLNSQNESGVRLVGQPFPLRTPQLLGRHLDFRSP